MTTELFASHYSRLGSPFSSFSLLNHIYIGSLSFQFTKRPKVRLESWAIGHAFKFKLKVWLLWVCSLINTLYKLSLLYSFNSFNGSRSVHIVLGPVCVHNIDAGCPCPAAGELSRRYLLRSSRPRPRLVDSESFPQPSDTAQVSPCSPGHAGIAHL